MTDNQQVCIHEQVCLSLQQAAEQCGQPLSVNDPAMKLSELGLDSLKLIEVVFDLELYFDIQADESAMASLHTVGDVIEMISLALRHSAGPC